MDEDRSSLSQHKECVDWALDLFVSSKAQFNVLLQLLMTLKIGPMVVYIRDALERSKCPMKFGNIHCVPCDEPKSGYYEKGKGVFLCQNFLESKAHTRDTLSHEMIHAFDYCTREFDERSCEQVLCSEVSSSEHTS